MECRSSEQDARLAARSERLRATGPIWWLSSSGALSFSLTTRDPFTLLLRRRSAARRWGAHQRRHGCKKQNEKKRTKAKNKNKNNRTRGSAFCLWRSAQRQTADGRRQTHGVQTPTTNLGQLTHLTGCVTTSHTPRQQQKRPEIRSLPSFPPFSAP